MDSLTKYAGRSIEHTVTGVLVKPEAEARDITLMEIGRIVRRRRGPVVVCIAAAFLLGCVYCLVSPRRYEATARIVINSESSNPLGIATDLPVALQDTSLVQETQVRILQSDTIAWDVVQQLRLDRRKELAGKYDGRLDSLDLATPAFRQHLLASFHDRLRVRSVPKTQIIEVSFRSQDPRLSADIVNGVSKAYLERNFRTRFNATMQASEWLGHQLDDLKRNVESKQEEFIEFQKKTGIVGTDETRNIIISRLDELNKNLASVQSERIIREARYRQALEANPQVMMELAPTSALSVLRGQEATLNMELAQLTAKYGNAYPKVVQLRTQLGQVETALQGEIRNVRQRLETEYRASARAERMANAEVTRQKEEAYKLNEAGIHFLLLKREVEGSRDLYDDLQKKLKEAGIVAGLKSSNVNVVDAAEIPARPAEPRIPLALTLATLLGGVCGLAVAFGVETLDTTISDPGLAAALTELPVLGVVPHSSSARKAARLSAGGGPSLLADPQSAFAEAFRVLRSTLILPVGGTPPKVLLITSALPGEGKTITAINVAAALAQHGQRVLLVDGDLRRSPLARHFNFPGTSGLSRCLIEAVDPGTALIPFPGVTDLDVLPAGPRPPAPAELDSARMRELVRSWREKYNHVVVDAAPVLGFNDALVLATMADAVMLVARYRFTGRQSLMRARDGLERVNVRPLGIVFNDMDANSCHYYDYYGYYERTYSRYHEESRNRAA